MSKDDVINSPFLWMTIEEIASSRSGAIKIGPFGSQLKKDELSKQGYKVYGQENIIAGDFSIGNRYVDASKFAQLQSCRLFPGDIVLTMMGTIGQCAIFPADAEDGIMDSHLLRIQVNQEIAYRDFVALVIGCEDVVGRQIVRTSHGSIMSGLSSKIVQRLRIPLPSLPEQRRIAEILDAADEAIRQTERLIAKLKAVKAGLLHDLLTRGLDGHGRLRDPLAHSEQFKDSPLGRIPRDWEVITLGDAISKSKGIIQTGPFGSQLHAEEYTDEGIPVIMPQDIEDSRVSEDQIARIPLKKARALARHRIIPNDVVFARRGDLSRCAPIGKREVGWLCGTGCLLVRPPERVIDGYWLAAIYQHDHSQRQIAARAVGSTMVNLNTSLLASLVIAKPFYDEQITISETLNAHKARIRAEEATLAKLRQVKRGLMDDLLTGRVRV
jgi:restriction endonuclease S subunit